MRELVARPTVVKSLVDDGSGLFAGCGHLTNG